ncbi:IclR family transcriptional regulator [Pseudomonas yamanorum]|uniref:Helix-turn-helix domain-containing protein n=1 Tax=Pseudomonas yamanorum TaxID=515393 RepID=A0A7Y8FF03_9PSED|nr:helix-turn-helix domain-containing protein [Pseudomonas yamanorum]NWE77778.1 helix-turn-helix domain-containing protein [Pseudomonas yamanorum]
MFSAPYENKDVRRRGIGSVEIGIAVLQAIVELGRAASLKQIAAKSGLDPSQTHRYISALVNTGMVKQAENGQYDLGYTAIRTGVAAIARFSVLDHADECAKRLTTETGVTTHVSVWGVHGPTIVRWNAGWPPIYTTLTVGSSLPVTRSSSGQIFMAYLPDGTTESFVAAEGYDSPAAKREELMKSIRDVRLTRLARSQGMIHGLPASASPIFGPGNALSAVVTAVMLDSIAEKHAEVIESRLKQLCSEGSLDTGF